MVMDPTFFIMKNKCIFWSVLDPFNHNWKYWKEEREAFGTKNEEDNLCGEDIYEIIF